MILAGKLCTPIREMLESDDYGSVIFHTNGYRQSAMTQISVLNLRRRHGYDFRTKLIDDNHIAVVRPGGENLPGISIDIREVE